MISTPARRCEPSFILNTFQPFDVSSRTRCSLCQHATEPAEGIDYRAKPAALHSTPTRTCNYVYTGISCVRIGGGSAPWPGFCSRQISPSLSFSILLFPPLSFPLYSPSPSLSLSSPPLHRYSRQRVTLLLFRRYLDWLAFQRTTLFPATTEIPVSFPPVYHLRENYFPRTNGIIRRDIRFPNECLDTNNWRPTKSFRGGRGR